MPTQMRLPVQPVQPRAEAINAVLAIVREGDEVAYFASGVPVFVHAKGDAAGQRLAAVQMTELGLARQDELSAALEVNRTTLYRQSRKVKAEGVLGCCARGKRPSHHAEEVHSFSPDLAGARDEQWHRQSYLQP